MFLLCNIEQDRRERRSDKARRDTAVRLIRHRNRLKLLFFKPEPCVIVFYLMLEHIVITDNVTQLFHRRNVPLLSPCHKSRIHKQHIIYEVGVKAVKVNALLHEKLIVRPGIGRLFKQEVHYLLHSLFTPADFA